MRAAGGAGVAASWRAISALARSSALELQPGQLTFIDIRPLTGSTSKANFVPHAQWILTFMVTVWG